MGSIISSPALTSPPKNTKASGLLNVAKSAQAWPSILPVNSNMSLAILSPLPAAMLMSSDVMSSAFISLSIEGSLVLASISRAVRATPVAEQYASRQPWRPHPHSLPPSRTIITWPSSPAKPSLPYTSCPLTTMPEPTPVPRVSMIKFFMPFATP